MITNFIGYYNFLGNSPLGIDSDLNGISDGWEIVTGNADMVRSVSDTQQLLEVKNTDDGSAGIRLIDISSEEGEILTLRSDAKVDGVNISGILRFVFRDSGGSAISFTTNSFTNSEYENIYEKNVTVPANTTTVQVYLLAKGDVVGGEGIVYFKNAILIKNLIK